MPRPGRPVNVEAVKQILARVSVPCQLGGGLRDQATIAPWLCRDWIVLLWALRRCATLTGSLEWPSFIRGDCSWGWTRGTAGLQPGPGSTSRAFRRWLLPGNLNRCHWPAIIYTDIERDGMLDGPNLESIAALAGSVKTPVIASGGIGELLDLEHLAALPVAGCIVGRALYEGRFSLSQAIRQAQARAAQMPGREGA